MVPIPPLKGNQETTIEMVDSSQPKIHTFEMKTWGGHFVEIISEAGENFTTTSLDSVGIFRSSWS